MAASIFYVIAMLNFGYEARLLLTDTHAMAMLCGEKDVYVECTLPLANDDSKINGDKQEMEQLGRIAALYSAVEKNRGKDATTDLFNAFRDDI